MGCGSSIEVSSGISHRSKGKANITRKKVFDIPKRKRAANQL